MIDLRQAAASLQSPEILVPRGTLYKQT